MSDLKIDLDTVYDIVLKVCESIKDPEKSKKLQQLLKDVGYASVGTYPINVVAEAEKNDDGMIMSFRSPNVFTIYCKGVANSIMEYFNKNGYGYESLDKLELDIHCSLVRSTVRYSLMYNQFRGYPGTEKQPYTYVSQLQEAMTCLSSRHGTSIKNIYGVMYERSQVSYSGKRVPAFRTASTLYHLYDYLCLVCGSSQGKEYSKFDVFNITKDLIDYKIKSIYVSVTGYRNTNFDNADTPLVSTPIFSQGYLEMTAEDVNYETMFECDRILSEYNYNINSVSMVKDKENDILNIYINAVK